MSRFPSPAPSKSRNIPIAVACGSVVLGMLLVAYASVPFYQFFVEATGYAGAIQRSAGNDAGVIEREMTVRFDANIAANLNWGVASSQPVTEQVGSLNSVTFLVSNTSNQTVSGAAILNVTPPIAGSYFKIVECFCFEDQTLAPGESAVFSITYFIDPELDNVSELDTVTDVTLSQNFYASQSRNS